MSDCCKNMLGSGSLPTLMDQMDHGLGCEAINFKCDDLVDDKTEDVGQSKTMRGKNKCKWTHGERKILLECFVWSGGKKDKRKYKQDQGFMG